MRNNGIPQWAVGIIVVLVALAALNILLHIGFGLVGLFFSIVGAILGFLFSKTGVLVACVALGAYIWHNRGVRRYDHRY